MGRPGPLGLQYVSTTKTTTSILGTYEEGDLRVGVRLFFSEERRKTKGRRKVGREGNCLCLTFGRSFPQIKRTNVETYYATPPSFLSTNTSVSGYPLIDRVERLYNENCSFYIFPYTKNETP